ncbi:bifunctional demethylmenaquinone methyltransferase/2-methoxy-6-polyprenyl-1,4-benzoquinol methylase UbiE [Amorphus orientalis]|uniref:Ubiquinone/menaquinone biosynthesis C-methyltransferase UbiE n=1 Tax=Amorphus orientalis TaxID=649198 RepID=A0AAE4AR03_9HYPH|nr:bifunctional demethylmenaquinone methyltransferase/2-methoxy-6-polyprenyl-1,4-benzoquinol methylase UbiE [Amorphus orientalis]MDQ0314651.1 demethylmenaquinone methyltransferase/2-methoxy-6-polyprenyl-1,4-benzoquinol methylase [Amorphus orientalis]
MSETESRTQGGSELPFGFRQVAAGDKQRLVDDVFHRVAQRYDLMNDLMSGGLHRLWKDAMVSWLSPPKSARGRYRVLDVAGGTGDIAFRILNRGGAGTSVTITDINGAMLGVGAERAEKKHLADRSRFVQANAEMLPFADRSHDAYTIAFGIRNVPDRAAALAEAYRVLPRGGRFMCLEFAPVDLPVLQQVYDTYSFRVIPPLGRAVTGDEQPYQYLVESIRTFPIPERFAFEIEEAGFSRVTFRLLSGGIAAIHSGFKV